MTSVNGFHGLGQPEETQVFKHEQVRWECNLCKSAFAAKETLKGTNSRNMKIYVLLINLWKYLMNEEFQQHKLMKHVEIQVIVTNVTFL